jgi:hypothetical protein
MNFFKKKPDNEENYRELKYEILKKFRGFPVYPDAQDSYSHKDILIMLRDGPEKENPKIAELGQRLEDKKNELFWSNYRRERLEFDFSSLKEILERKDFVIQKLRENK